MPPHSSSLVWKIPWTAEPGGLQSMGSQRVRHDWLTSLSLFPFMHWRRKWQPTPVLLSGKSHGQRSLVGCSSWGREESDTTERLHFHYSLHALGKEMATHSSVLAWRIPGKGEPGRLLSMGLHRVGHDWSDLAARQQKGILGHKSFPHLYWNTILCFAATVVTVYTAFLIISDWTPVMWHQSTFFILKKSHYLFL